MNEYLSKKISFFHIFGVFVVLYIHAFLPNIEASPFDEVQSFMAHTLCRVFHPMYFGIAGYLFYINIKEGKIAEFIRKMKSRFRSLVIPYIICNLLGGAFIVWVSQYNIPSGNIENAMDYYQSHYILLFLFYKPALGQLWFVRDLIIVTIVSYPLYYSFKKIKVWTLWGLLLLVFLTSNSILLSIFSFSVGAYLGIYKIDVQQHKYKLLIYLSACAYLLAFGFLFKDMEYHIVAISAWSLFLALWLLYDKIHFFRLNLGGHNYGFFVYVFHDPLMSLTKFALLPIYKDSIAMQCTIYMILPIVFFYSLSIVAYSIKKASPLAYGLLTGGR